MAHPDCKPDDPQVPDEEGLLRRIHPDHVRDGAITYEAFKHPDRFRTSVEVASKSSPEACLAHRFPEGIKPKYVDKKCRQLLKQNWKVASLPAKFPRDFNQTVYLDPVEIITGNEVFVNDAHAEICGEKSRALLLKMADKAQIVLP